ncbi:MAG TPA: LptE family protein [Phycisphaerales bacterium]|nr:LptE family protein [Phycisphaerales bacterium]
MTKPTASSRAAALAAIGLAVCLAGCSADPTRGYSFSSTFDHTAHTVAVPIFANETYASGLEVRLTEAIIAEIQRTTPWRVVGAESAATTLQGSIEEVEMTRLSRQRNTGLVQEQALRVTVSFDWIDNRSGRTTVSRRRFSSVASFVPHHGVGEPIEIGESGAVRELARDIVAELRSDW